MSQSNLSDDERQRMQALEKLIVPIEIMYGPETDRAHEHGGALSSTEARILLFPVRSLAGLFAWITCPTVLERLKRDLRRLRWGNFPELEKIVIDFGGDNHRAYVTRNCSISTPTNQIVLEDFAFDVNATKADEINTLAYWLSAYALPQKSTYLYWRNKLQTGLVVLSDEVFRDFVQFSTEVISRNRIGETGTVEAGALWSEERLPSETLMYSLVLASDPRDAGLASGYDQVKSASEIIKEAMKPKLFENVVQMGGNATVGEGFIKITPANPFSPLQIVADTLGAPLQDQVHFTESSGEPAGLATVKEQSAAPEIPIRGVLGDYSPEEKRIVLYQRGVTWASDQLSVPEEQLVEIVKLHLATLALAHLGRDKFNLPCDLKTYRNIDLAILENLTRIVVHHILNATEFKDHFPELVTTFERLNERQPEIFRQWVKHQNVSSGLVWRAILSVRASQLEETPLDYAAVEAALQEEKEKQNNANDNAADVSSDTI